MNKIILLSFLTFLKAEEFCSKNDENLSCQSINNSKKWQNPLENVQNIHILTNKQKLNDFFLIGKLQLLIFMEPGNLL